MPIKRPQLVNNEIYHIVIRGAGDSLIFKNEDDRYRAIFSLYEFNTKGSIEIREQRKKRKIIKASGEPFSDNRKLLVEIWAFWFMSNHIHLLLKQKKDGGISEFVKKFGAGYVGYFNKKHNRKGPLFAKFRAVHIKDDKQLITVFVYIHTNGISLIESKWKERGISNPKKVIEFLENYKWSSFQDYIGKKNFPSVTSREFLLNIMGGEKGCKEIIDDFVRYKKTFKGFDEVILE
ncbi:MAG: transposase [Patescibacteria group bacterium]